MTQLIKINLKTIRKNPDSGKTEHVPTERTIYFTCNDLPQFLVDGKNCIVTEKMVLYNGYYEECFYKGVILNFTEVQKYIDKLGRLPESFTIDIDQQYVEIHHPIRDYLYSYQNPMIECDYCEAEFRYSELKEELDDDYQFAMNICPVCGQFDCVDLEFETIDEALKRKKLKEF